MMKSSFLLLLFLLIPNLSHAFIFPNQERRLNAKTSIDPNFHCNQEMMLSYGLSGQSSPSPDPHQYCPSITSNCCTNQDEISSMYMWTTDSRPRVEVFYEVYLYMVKYILGFSAEGALLAKDFSTSSNDDCKAAATEFTDLSLNPKLTSIIYGSYADSFGAMGNIRSGFYCILCDALTQQALQDFWSVTNLFYSDRIYFSSEFCVTLVDKTIQSSYFAATFLKTYTTSLAKLMQCKNGSPGVLKFEMSFLTVQQVKNCFFFKNKYFFFYCEFYCQRFDLVSKSDILESDYDQLKTFFVYIRDNKSNTFYNPNNNVLSAGAYEEKYVTDNLSYASGIKVFFPAASSHSVDLSKYSTDIVYTGGMNPWISVTKGLYPLAISGAYIQKVILLTIFSLFCLIK